MKPLPRAFLLLALGAVVALSPALAAFSEPRPEADEAVVLTAGAGPVSLLPSFRVRLDRLGVAPSFSLEPERFAFFRLPVRGPGGLGAALREEPFLDRGVWGAVTVVNGGASSDWILAGDGKGFRPSEIVVVTARGGEAHIGGDALEAVRYAPGVADMVGYFLDLPRGERTTLYVRLPPGGAFGPGLALWPVAAFSDRARLISALAGFLVGLMLFACAAALHFIAGSEPARVAVAVVYVATAFASVALAANGGGLSATLAREGFDRFAAAFALGFIALGAEAALALMEGSGHPGRAGMAARVAFGAAVTLAATARLSPLLSFAPPVGLFLHVCAFVYRGAGRYLSASREARNEARRLRFSLEEMASSGRDFMTTGAAALRGPLFGILGILEDMDARLSGGGPSDERDNAADLGLARDEATRLLELVNSLLAVSTMESGVDAPRAESFDLGAVARTAVNPLRYSLGRAGVAFALDVPIVEMSGDVTVVYRLLRAVCERASRAEGATTLRVAASPGDELVTVTVEDDGAAPEPGDIDGTVAARLAALAGGALAVSRSDGRNVHVITLPRRYDAAPPRGRPAVRGRPLPEPSERPGAEAGLAGGVGGAGAGEAAAGYALVVCDDPVALFTLKRRFENAAWRVVAMVSAKAALERAVGGEEFDIVVVDSYMPEMTGFEFCEAYRKQRPRVPVMLLVESGRPDEIARVFKCGANDYLARSASGLELVARARTHVELAASMRRELERAASMAEFDKYRTLAMLAAGVAHEINTPNNAVLRNVPMLREIWAGIEPSLERLSREEGGFAVRGFSHDDLRREVPGMLSDLYMGAQDIKKIVECLKEYTRERSSEALSLIDANESVQYATRLLRHAIVVSTDRFEARLADDLPRVRADRLKLTQVVVNVLENALQALPDRRKGVWVASFFEPGDESSPDRVCICVRDEGVGMAPEHLASAFDPFFTTKRERGGTGLGLAVSSGIVRELGGSIELRSEPGAGTVAFVRLPVPREEVQEKA